MDAWVDLALMNAAHAGVLACLVFLATRAWKNPHAARALWLCVLLKLVAPPLYRFPIPAWRTGGASSPVASPSATEDAVAELPPIAVTMEQAIAPATVPEMPPLAGEQAPPAFVFAEPAPELILPPAPTFEAPDQFELVEVPARAEPIVPALDLSGGAAPLPPPKPIDPAPIPWRWFVALAWGLGSAAWISLSLSRAIRFSRLVRQMEPADDALKAQAAKLADAIGLRRAPEVRVVEGVVPPLLWAFGGRGVIVLPGALIRELEPEERGAILLHEMAHLRRRDHWTRRLEWMVLAAYWWHPAAWWARRELQVAEELCCDAAVLRVVPGDARAYGRALLRTMEFLSDGCARAPALASGIGDSASLMKRRMRMIVQRKGCERLGRPASLAIVVLGIAVISGAAQPPPSTGPSDPPPIAGDPSSATAEVPHTEAVPAPASAEAVLPVAPGPPAIPAPATAPPSAPGAPPTPALDPAGNPFEAAPTPDPTRYPFEATPGDDRLSAMEGRLQRMEAMIERLALVQERGPGGSVPAAPPQGGKVAGLRSGTKKAKQEALVEKLGELSEIRRQLADLNARSQKLSQEVRGLATELGLNASDYGGMGSGYGGMGMEGMMPGMMPGGYSGGMGMMMGAGRPTERTPEPEHAPATRQH